MNASQTHLCALLVAGSLAWAAGACSDDERPPPPPPPRLGDAGPASCSEISGGTPDGKHVRVGGHVATCAADGLECPLFGPAFSATCDAGAQPYATCASGIWQLTCAELPNETSTESQADAGADKS